MRGQQEHTRTHTQTDVGDVARTDKKFVSQICNTHTHTHTHTHTTQHTHTQHHTTPHNTHTTHNTHTQTCGCFTRVSARWIVFFQNACASAFSAGGLACLMNSSASTHDITPEGVVMLLIMMKMILCVCV